MEFGGALSAPPAGSGAEPQPCRNRNLVHFSLKIRHLEATIIIINHIVQLLSSKNAHLSQWRGFEPPNSPSGYEYATVHLYPKMHQRCEFGKNRSKTFQDTALTVLRHGRTDGRYEHDRNITRYAPIQPYHVGGGIKNKAWKCGNLIG